MHQQVIYGNSLAIETNASGMRGLLCKSVDGKYFFRVTQTNGEFLDFDLRHDDLEVTIASDALASFYTAEDFAVLDHTSTVLGLKAQH